MTEPRSPIYLDAQATTPVDPRVLEEMLPYFSERFGNAASRTHAHGWRAAEAVEVARERLARAIGAPPKAIVFTSGATESSNLAILGVARAYASKGRHVVTCAVEHAAVLDPCRELTRSGYDVTLLPVDPAGRVSPAAVEAAVRPDTILVSIMVANNEIGTLEPIAEIGQVTRAHGIVFHTDAAQALGKVPLDVEALSADLVSLSAHKLYGPKGVGALYVRPARPRVRLHPILFGGGHEGGLRSGTANVPGIVGFGRAAELAASALPEESSRLTALAGRLLAGIASRVNGVTLNGPPLSERLPGNLNVALEGVPADDFLADCRAIAASAGSACTSASAEPSHVLRAIGLSDALLRSSIRLGIGRFTTEAEIDAAIDTIAATVERIRSRRATIR